MAHEVTAAGVTIERYGIHCQTYAEAYRRAEVMNREQQPSAMNETDAASKRMTASDGHVGSGTDGNSVTAKGGK